MWRLPMDFLWPGRLPNPERFLFFEIVCRKHSALEDERISFQGKKGAGRKERACEFRLSVVWGSGVRVCFAVSIQLSPINDYHFGNVFLLDVLL